MKIERRLQSVLFLLTTCLVFTIQAWAQEEPGTLTNDQDDDSELEIVEQGRHSEILAAPDVDWNIYSRVQLDRATVEFRKNWVRDQRQWSGITIREADQQRIKSDTADLLDKVLTQELTTDGFYTMADESGADVMRFTPRIVDLDVVAPDRARNYIGGALTDSQGRMTLELEIRDSVSGSLLATTRHHKEDPYKGYMEWTTSPTNRQAARLMLLRWAFDLREWLDEARSGAKGTAN